MLLVQIYFILFYFIFILYIFFISLLSDYLLKLVRQLTMKKFINLLVNGIGMEGSFILL